MATIDVISETEQDGGWEFEVVVRAGEESPDRTCRLQLSWVDYEFWSGGSVAPSRVGGAVVRYLIETHPEEGLPAALDASTARRRHPDIDERLRAYL